MGPRDGHSTVQYGLKQGHIFGFIGSTDHHSAHPGHYGFGRLAALGRCLNTRRDLGRDPRAAHGRPHRGSHPA
jgi:hypothetical protein